MRPTLPLLGTLALVASGCLNQVSELTQLTGGHLDAGSDGGHTCAGESGWTAVEPQLVDFGRTLVGSVATQSVTIYNCSDLDLGVTPEPLAGSQATLFGMNRAGGATFMVPARGSAQIQLSYAPIVPSALDSASLTFSMSEGGDRSIQMQGSAMGSCLQISPVPLSFGFVQPGSLASQPLHLTNACTDKITVSSVTIQNPGTPAAFLIAGDSWTGGDLASGESFDVTVRFAPPQWGQFDGEIDIASTDNANVTPVPLTGYGGGAIFSCLPPSLYFWSVDVNTTTTLSVICTNSGSDVPGHPEAGVILGALSIDDPVFAAQVDPGQANPASAAQPLTAGHSVQIDVAYTPPMRGIDVGTLTIHSNVSDGSEGVAPPAIALWGEGVYYVTCPLDVSPQNLSFGKVAVGSSSTSSFTVSNSSQTDCETLGFTLSTDCAPAFSLPNGPVAPQVLAPGATATIDVTFTPPGDGLFECALVAGADAGLYGMAGQGTH
jgi:hypothetical protein